MSCCRIAPSPHSCAGMPFPRRRGGGFGGGGVKVVWWRSRICAGIREPHGERGKGRFEKWIEDFARDRQVPAGERIIRMVATATSSPLAQYISSPVTVLHSLDPRVKQVWLLALIVLSSRAHMIIRVGTVLLVTATSVLTLPKRVWQDQLARAFVLSGLLFVMGALGTDGVTPVMQVRTPPPALESLPPLPPALNRYSYVLFRWGPLQLTRKGVSLAGAASCLSFTVLQSASLCLATTTSEQLAGALRWFLKPLRAFGVTVDEMILSLLLSLRFVGLVFDEVRNLALAVVARGVHWKSMKLRETLDYYALLIGRLFQNLFYHSERIAEAMVARGYRGDPEKHKLYLLSAPSLGRNDMLSLAVLVLIFTAAAVSEALL